MKILSKLALVFVLLGINTVPAFSTTWLHYAPNRYIDMDSIKKQNGYIYFLHKIYNDGRFDNNVYYSLEYSCANINMRQIKIIRIIDYNKQNIVIDDYEGSNSFRNVVPKTTGENAFEIVKCYANGTITRADFKRLEEYLNKKKNN